ncbi:MAG: M1 family aminopeptidase [Methyloversatilis sp.]|uniref:M1 family metallopeptidase n=1 Tax=Methyloversatilis sp. TaxID=2569862 RepID=UPI002733F8F8|nr:M1 family aminopeptidase [Methyloversatilis sp.]MDP2870433.1 M1 family aminopeptidase [Methyloversatilis sp.]
MRRLPGWRALAGQLAVGLCAALPGLPALAAPQLDLTVRLEPAQGNLSAQALIALPAHEAIDLRIDARHRITSMQLDGGALRASTEGGLQRIRIAASSQPRRLELRWAIRADAPDAAASHRDTLTAFAPQIGEAGSFLPAGGAWYPLPFDGAGPLLHRYRLTVDLPAAQHALAPGDRLSDTVRDGRRTVRFDMTHDSEGADLMAGPWVEAERSVRSIDGRRLTLATLFHPDIADQAAGYLDVAASHLARIEQTLGAYPYSRFTIASSPTPTGFGMASLTYLGIDVLRLPFIRHTSLPHEILHNWWGNGVYLALAGGNWSEGLTTFMADYALREAKEGDDGARAMRLDWLRGLSALSPAAQGSLSSFGGRTHDASQSIGYHKAALVFVMLRDTLGATAFDSALRDFWQMHRHRRAGWQDIRAAFERASGRDLGRHFALWVDGSGLAAPVISEAVAGPGGLTVTLQQPAPPYPLEVPLHVRVAGATRVEQVALHAAQARVTLPLTADCAELALDPDFRLARRLAPGEAPPVLREATLDDALGLTVLPGDERLSAAARTLTKKWLDRAPTVIDAAQPPGRASRMVIGSFAGIDGWLARHHLPARDRDGEVVAWALRAPAGGTLALVAARDALALEKATRALPHYGQQGWVTLTGGRAASRGQWPAATAWTTVCVR